MLRYRCRLASCVTDNKTLRRLNLKSLLLMAACYRKFKTCRTFFSTVLLLIVISTAYEIACIVQNIDKHPFLCAFSCYSNSKAIMTMKPSSSKEMLFLHGIRSLSMLSIVIGHTYMITYWLAPAMNSHALIDWIGDVSSMLVLVGFMGVDTFFMLSSLLMTLSVFRELDKT